MATAKLPTDAFRDSPFLKACRREPTDVTPIWLMRQAGRYMAEYREIRAKVSFLELCKDPALATEVTVTAAERLGVDAAILFADILLILEPLGFDLEFAKGEGPVIHNPIREAGDVDRVRRLLDVEPLAYVMRAVRRSASALRPVDPPDRLRRRPLHPGLLRDRRGRLAALREGQGLHVPRPRRLGRADVDPRRRHGALPERPGRRGRPGPPALRQLGRDPRPRRLPTVRPAAHASALRSPRPRSPRSTSGPTPRPCWNSSATPAAT